MKIVRQKNIKTKRWSGGTTSEIYIYPQNSDYKKLDFSFRLSKATIEIEHSIFTPLSKIKRQLMVLDGSLELNHTNHHNSKLEPFETDIFSGDWETKSIGKVTDFNLMLSSNTEGYLTTIHSDERKMINVYSKCDIICFYAAKGAISYKNERLFENEMIVLNNPNDKTEISLEAFSSIIVTRIWTKFN
ncbi:MAG: HutD family protein [Crocinitomicaceae bacterium]